MSPQKSLKPGDPTPHGGQKRKKPADSGGSSNKRIKSGDSGGPSNKRIKSGDGKKTSHQQSKNGGGQPAGQQSKQNSGTKRQRTQRDARTLVTQTTSKAFKNGELDVDRFVKSREFEIRSLQDGLDRSHSGRNSRAFQVVPRDMRRRAGAWDARRVPKDRRARAAREIAEDNTPTGKARKKKLTRHMQLRLDTVKRLRALGAKRQAANDKGEEVKVIHQDKGAGSTTETAVKTRDAKIKKNILRAPPLLKAKFRKRQIHKTWLPTHVFHAKRAHMSPPTDPIWRFALPLGPTAKSYRPTHRAMSERGAIAWDVSYMATIGLEGVEASLIGLLKGLHVRIPEGPLKRLWINGVRSWHGWLFTREDATRVICSATVVWRAEKDEADVPGPAEPVATKPTKPVTRKLLIRAHPSAFHQLWEEIMRLCKVQKPQVAAEDLRYEIGSIEVVGPGATEALLTALQPSYEEDGKSIDNEGRLWQSLCGLETPGSLPPNVILAFKASDPRLQHPPRTLQLPSDPENLEKSFESIIAFDAREQCPPQALFDNRSRRAAVSAMQSQKAINRRKTQSAPGEYPTPQPTDPRIPVLVLASPLGASTANAGSRSKSVAWTVLLPWKAVSSVWQSVMYYRLSSGGQPRLGGLEQQRQLAFENGTAWWPGDFPGTQAGDEWIEKETESRKKTWERRPKSRRVAFDSLDLGNGRKGEIGCGWGMPFELLKMSADGARAEEMQLDAPQPPCKAGDASMRHMLAIQASPLLLSPVTTPEKDESTATALFTARITLLGRGTPSPCARIYSLPASDPELLKRWSSLLPPSYRPAQLVRPRHRPAAVQNGGGDISALARALLVNTRDEEREDHPPVPGAENLMGFLTSGGFNLREGKGTGMASLGLARVRAAYMSLQERHRYLCIVRNSGETVGRLAKWEMV